MAKGDGYGDGELVFLARKHLKEDRSKPALGPNDWLRVSGLSFLCAREEILCARYDLPRKDEISADLSVIFEHGHSLHWGLQNRILPRMGVLLGMWRCACCGYVHGGREGAWEYGTFTAQEFASRQVMRPERCSKCKTPLSDENCLFIEQTFTHEGHKLSGHSDGFLKIPGLDGLGILEAKSINPKGASEMRMCPKLDHVIQAHCYMWLTGLRWAKILYWDKAGGGLRSFVEHTIEYDEGTVEQVEGLLRTIREGLSSKELPDRICEVRTCVRAKACGAADYCFRG
jgi:hypothetical protein